MTEDEENAYDQIAPTTEQENRDAEEEGVKEAENFVYFNPNRVVEQRHYDIGIELQSTCSVPPVETTGIMLPDEEYLTLLKSLNLRQREFFSHIVHWIKCKDEPVYAFLTGGADVGKSFVIRALNQSLYRILNLRDGENPDDIRILLCALLNLNIHTSYFSHAVNYSHEYVTFWYVLTFTYDQFWDFNRYEFFTNV